MHIFLCKMALKCYFVIKLLKKRSIFPPFLFLRVSIRRADSASSAESERGGEGDGLGSPLAGFSPNTEISFLMISPQLLDICPVFLLVFFFS